MYEDLGPEAIRRLRVENFPAIVINDIYGRDLYQEVREKKIDGDVMGMRELLLKNPVIPAIKDEKTYNAAVDSPNEIVFIILSNLMEIENMVKVLKEKIRKYTYI